MKRLLKNPAFFIFLGFLFLAFFIGQTVAPTWTSKKINVSAAIDEAGFLSYSYNGTTDYIRSDQVVPIENATLTPDHLASLNAKGLSPSLHMEIVSETQAGSTTYAVLIAQKHWRLWAFLPAGTVLILCWITKEPVISLLSGIIIGSFLLGKYDVMGDVIIPELSTRNAATIIVLYLWLLGSLMGIWSRTGAAKAFADFITKHCVRGPRSAKLVAWFLGVIFFQEGTI